MSDGIIALGRRCMSPRPEDRPDFKEVVEVGVMHGAFVWLRSRLSSPFAGKDDSARTTVSAWDG